jgi:hypothetical protein
MANEHVRIEPDGTYVCRHCNDFYKPNLPCPITMAEVMMAEWMRLHKDCEAWTYGKASAIEANTSP